MVEARCSTIRLPSLNIVKEVFCYSEAIQAVVAAYRISFSGETVSQKGSSDLAIARHLFRRVAPDLRFNPV
jgi:hypothetical protein